MPQLTKGVGRALLFGSRITHLFRDDASNAVVATPDTLGRHTVVATDGTYTKTGGRLVFTAQTTPVWGDQGIIMLPAVDANWVRANGLALFSTLNLSTWEESGIGLHTAAAVVDPDSMETALQANTTDGRLDDENGESIYTGLSLSTDYKIAQVLRATGDYTFLHDGTEWLLIRISDAGATSALYAVLANLDGAGDYDTRRITQLPSGLITKPVVSDNFSDTSSPFVTDGAGHQEADGNGSGVTWQQESGWTNASNKAQNAPAAGSDVIVNGGMDADTDWTKGTGWTIAAGVATKAPGSNGNLIAEVAPLVAGGWYTITFTVLNYVAGTFRNRLTGVDGVARSADGTHTETRISTGTAYAIRCLSTADGDVDDISAQQIALADLLRLGQTSYTDVIARDVLTVGDGQAGVAVRWDSQSSPANGIIVFRDRAATGSGIVVGKYVAGVYTEVSATSVAYSAGDQLEVRCIGDEVRVFNEGVHVVTNTVSDAGIVSNTLHGLLDPGASSSTHENLEVWPVNAINYDKYFVGA